MWKVREIGFLGVIMGPEGGKGESGRCYKLANAPVH